MAVIVIVPSVVFPSPTVIVSVPIPFTVAVAIPVPFLVLVAVVATTITITITVPFTVSSVLAVSIFIFSILRRFLAFATGGGSTVLRSFLLAKAFLLTFDIFGEGGPTSLFIFECLILAQVFEQWYCLDKIRWVRGGSEADSYLLV